MIVSPSGSLLRLKSSILEFSLLDSSLHFQDRAVPLENLRATVRKREEPSASTETTGGDQGAASQAPLGDQIILAVSCERGATCFSLPSQKPIYSYKSPDCSSAHLAAQTVAWLGDKKSTSVLLLFSSDGKVKGENCCLPTRSIISPLSSLSSQSAALPAPAGGQSGAAHERQGLQDTEILNRRVGNLLLQSKPGQHI